ncbi:MAG: peptidylprolyl isomerase [Actinobacteria bacterium]|uniref:Peptidyl-prolyl cis-trans isomerase n=1 Tax=Candidatus Fonsibacter lacus TaxID=2576439 RepID=A0A965GCB2_9PROT|nr:peptidylprolyl isomerase [Candidatus Fonsibacter lacus]
MKSTSRLPVRISSNTYKGFLAGALLLIFLAGCTSAPDTPDAAPTPTISSSPSSVANSASFCESSTATPRDPLAPSTPTSYLPKKIYTLTLETNCGVIEIEADGRKAPATVSTIGFLANAKYYDGTLCHRLTTSGIFILQCGDPQGDGGGNPGFNFADENLPNEGENNYPKGTVAMANSGPNTNGSQFFLVYADTTLGPNYSIWGKVRKGLDLLEKIAALGTKQGGPDGEPFFPIEIRTAQLK